MTTQGASSLLERLKAHQDRALDIAARAEKLLAENDPKLVADLANARWEMMRAMMPYVAFKHGELFPAMLASGRSENVAATMQLRKDCVTLGEDFKAYVARWSSVSVADHWSEFRPAAITMLSRLRSHIARELRAAESMLFVVERRALREA